MEKKIPASKAFKEYSDMVYRLAFARVKNKFDADDILQDVFIRYMKSKQEVSDLEHAKALLIRNTINCTKSLFLSNARKKAAPLDEFMSVDMPSRDTLEAVLNLPMKYRTVIHLHYYCGYGIDELARILDTKPSTVKSQLHRARLKLKDYLEGDEFDVQKELL